MEPVLNKAHPSPPRGEGCLIDVKVLTRLLKLWRRRKVSDFNQIKLLRLFLGCECKHLMDANGRFQSENFDELRRLTGFRVIGQMIEQARLSGTFYMTGEADKPTKFISSPLWEKCAPEARTLDELLQINTTLRSKVNDNEDEDEGKKEKNSLKEKEAEKEKRPLKERKRRNLKELLPENLKLVEDFFTRIKAKPELCYEFFTGYTEKFKERGYTQNWAERITETIWEDFTRAYLAKNIEFLEAEDVSRTIILRNITARQDGKPNWFGSFIGAAIEKTKQLIKQENEQRRTDTNTSRHWS